MRQLLRTVEEILGARVSVRTDVSVLSRELQRVFVHAMLSRTGDQWVTWPGRLYVANYSKQDLENGI